MRECRQWSPDNDPDSRWRWDVLWKDPASGRQQQLQVTALMPYHAPEELLVHQRDIARHCIAREINRKCGVAAMINETRTLPLPIGIAYARFV
jgi:hypothetical protein